MNKHESFPLFAPEAPDSFEMLEAMVSKTGNIEYMGPMRTVSVRMPMIDYCTIEAMSQHSGQSKNKLLNQMIRVCLERLNESLSREDAEAIASLRGKLIGELLPDDVKDQLEGK